MTTKDISKLLSKNEFLIFSKKLYELAEDMEDLYRVKQNKGKNNTKTYQNTDVLDEYLKEHAGTRKSKISQRI